MIRRPRQLPALILALGLLSSATPPQRQALEDGDLAPLAASLGAYLEARGSTVGLGEARDRLTGLLAEFGQLSGSEHPLCNDAALGRALWLSHRYGKQKLRKGKVTEDRFESALLGGEGGAFGEQGLAYAYRVPKDYQPGERAYPLVLAIPDADERPADHLRDHWSSGEFRDGAIVVCPEMPAERAEWDQVMVNGRPGGLCHVLAALRLAGRRFAVDFERVYVAGRGKSVPAAVAAGNYSPQRFAGVIGRSGDVGELGPENFGNLPTYFAGAGARATAFRESLREAGHDHCHLDPGGKQGAVWSWIQDHARNSHPTSVELVVGKPFPTRANWLRVAPISPEARASATIDRELNTIRIEGSGVSHVTLYLNDSLVDLGKPVVLVSNGVEQRITIRRHLPTTLALLHDGTSDEACVYVAEVVLDMSPEATTPAAPAVPVADDEYEERLAAAAEDAQALWQLHLWCLDSGREARSPAVLARLVRAEPDHADARAALGHVATGGQWFTDPRALSRFERSQDPEVAADRGYVLHKGLWMHPKERSQVGKGRVKDQQTGQWLGAADRKRLANGWVRQDLTWVSPEEAGRVDDGLWLVDGEWVGAAEADQRHARLDGMWTIPTAEVLLHASVDRRTAEQALRHMSRALEDLRKVFGAEPVLPLEVAVLRDEEQYDRFAFGAPDGSRPATHAGRLHVIHSAYFAESWFPRLEGEARHAGMGVCYWNAEAPYGDLYGVHSARLAVGLSYVDALDPSPKAVRKALSKGVGPSHYAAYEREKQLPRWLRYGGAVYAERYFHDDSVGAGGAPWWARNWSLDNLRGRGELFGLERVFAFQLNPEDREAGLQLLIEAGLAVAFLVDGGCEPVTAEHERLKQALRSGSVSAKLLADLEAALLAHEDELRVFGGL